MVCVEPFRFCQLETRLVPMTFEDNGRQKTLNVPGIFETTVKAVRGADDDGDAIISNLHNVIHGPVHTMARGQNPSHRPNDRFCSQGYTCTLLLLFLAGFGE
ncbi:MAG: hypothetical protein Ct9H300mP25_09230 [Acidobacteriota bacterium]|nr:MAG: hypothetical protein Ct9H300mP25_09230 [Acidobacteriota bacterium]